MAFKVDSSFLRFVTMGAIGTRAIIEDLRRQSFQPVELERYCTTNKIWATKVKRLRLPDLLCVKTGARFEARAKSSLAIRMSDAPNNPDRAWDAGLRDDDVVALTRVTEDDDRFVASANPQYFSVRELRHCAALSRLGAAKSASEGAERDRTWPSIVPARPGTVLEINRTQLKVEFGGDNLAPRRQTYALSGKTCYHPVGGQFSALDTIIAGLPAQKENLRSHVGRRYDPLNELQSGSELDRYAAIKAIRFRPDLGRRPVSILEQMIREEDDSRVRLEAAGSAAHLGSGYGQDYLHRAAADNDDSPMQMEAVFILSEIHEAFARDVLVQIAGDRDIENDEVHQAAVWGLGERGHRRYGSLLSFIDAPSEEVALHAIAAFGSDANQQTIAELVGLLERGTARQASAASECLRLIGSRQAVTEVNRLAASGSPWALATLARLPLDEVVQQISPNTAEKLEPLVLLTQAKNWIASDAKRATLLSLTQQKL